MGWCSRHPVLADTCSNRFEAVFHRAILDAEKMRIPARQASLARFLLCPRTMNRRNFQRLLLPALVAAAVGLASPVFADPARSVVSQLRCDDQGDCGPIRRLDGADWFFSFMLADLGMVTGAMVGGGLGLLASDGLGFGEGNQELWTSPVGIGALLGATTGTAAMVYAYGEANGYDGSFLMSYVGAALGAGAVFALGQIEDDSPGLLIMSSFVLPALGATIGYAFSIEDRIPDAPVGALLKVSRERIQLGMPTVTYAPSEDGDYLGITLVDGTF
ncbi:MAG: hypothetical protein ACI9MR_003558 [Myxococcota bacterium]